jgi:para-aminobenzoate synthetase/4-amino-4-deoxychorismate lyase
VAPWHQLPPSIHSLIAENPNSVLLQTARFDAANQTSYLYLHPLRILQTNNLEDLPTLFDEIEAAIAQGHHLAGYFHYECGYHFEPRTNTPAFQHATPTPLAWFGIYTAPIAFHHATGHFSHPPPGPIQPASHPSQALCVPSALNIEATAYAQKILAIKDLIAAGDTYQVNFTDTVSLRTPLSPADTFSTLIRQQPVAYAAFLNIDGHPILSLSPELFFHLDENTILTRPMKGTMPRGLDSAEDTRAALALQNDEKNRSEHVMIVDLLRNDLGRICTLGSVHVRDLFTIERYETLHQMTSTVAGTLHPGLSNAALPFYEIFRSLFPSGSITGAPKIRTMQIIRDLEAQPRGIYTGAIGHITPGRPDQSRKATFNVAIRTLTLNESEASMGVGGAIVADSQPAAEYAECLLKTTFLTRTPNDFQLIETVLYDPALQGDSYYLLDLHLDRLAASAAYFSFPCDRYAIQQQLTALAHTLTGATRYRIRLLLHPDGHVTFTPTLFSPTSPTGCVSIANERTLSTDLFLRHKTTRRTLYDLAYQQAIATGYDEVLFLNERGELTEGAISNLFLRVGDTLFTPPLSSGVLPGIYRRHLLETHPKAQEKVLTLEDLHIADAILICNSLRGMNEIRL